MTASFGLEPRYLDAIRALASKFWTIDRLRIFGSRARGDYKPASDIDLAVDGVLFHFTDLLDFRARLDELPLIFKFDVMPINGLESQTLKDAIDREGITIYERESTER